MTALTKTLAQAFRDAPDHVKRDLGILPPLAAPKSQTPLEEIARSLANQAPWYCLVITTTEGEERKLDDAAESHAPRGREKLCRDLARLGLEIYSPLGKIVKPVKRRGGYRNIQIRRPAFPGYLFVGVAGAVDWMAVRDLDGVLGVIANADRAPLRLHQIDIDELRAREARGEFDWDYVPDREAETSKFGIVQGDHVLVKGGALGRFTAVVRKTPRSRRIELAPDIFPENVVYVDVRDIEHIP